MAILQQDLLKQRIGNDLYSRFEKEAEKEVALAMEMPLLDQWRKEKYYRPRWLFNDLLVEFETLEKLGVKISALEIINILFRSKILFAVQNEDEYHQRIGGGLDVYEIRWEDKVKGVDQIISDRLDSLNESIQNRTLLTPITHFDCPDGLGNPDIFFEALFKKLNMPFSCYFNNERLLEKYKNLKPNLSKYSMVDAERYFTSPSFGFTITGSENYVYFYASTYLRTFLNLLRVAGFVYRPQMDFGREVNITAPTSSVFLDSNSLGVFVWDEDAKKPWEKIADGSLFLSFGYRGLSKMYLDSRCFGGIEKYFVDNKIILDSLSNPWTPRNLNDVAPIVDILSSVTQIPDLGSKLLLCYCCLEHLFVPKNIIKDNTKYIIGAINALRPDFLPWFDRLYKARCDYAHKGYVIKNSDIISLVFESVSNITSLLVAKLKQN